MPKFIAGHTMAWCLLWLTWALLAPIVAGPLPALRAEHNCPSPVVIHGIGSDLKTYVRTIDRCAQNEHLAAPGKERK